MGTTDGLPDDGGDLLTPREVQHRCRCKNVRTVRRWMSAGVLVDGRRVRLPGLRVGGRWYVTRAGLDGFLAACNPAPVPVPASPVKADREARAAVAEYYARYG